LIKKLVLTVILFFCAASPLGAGGQYPPYPDTWDLRVPVSPGATFPRLRVYKLENGEVIVGYADKGTPKTRSNNVLMLKNLRYVEFFSGKPIRSLDEANGEFVLHDGRTSKVVKMKRNSWPTGTELKDGSYVLSSKNVLKDCYLGPDSNQLHRYVSSTPPFQKELNPAKVIFVLLDRPIKWRGADYEECDEADKELSVRVQALYGEILALDDGGFLLIDEIIGWIVRFNSDMTTQSKLLNKRIFIFDLDSAEVDKNGFVPGKTNDDYRDGAGKIKMQAVLDDLYAYLRAMEPGKK
jgi:hypothetical protein